MKNEQIKPVFPSKGRFRWVSKECRLFVKLEKEHSLFRYPRNALLKREIICIALFIGFLSAQQSGHQFIEYQRIQNKLQQGWNTWNNSSVLQQVLLPQGFAINLAFKQHYFLEEQYLSSALIGRRGDNTETIRPGPHAYDGSYTQLEIQWEGLDARIETAHSGKDLVMLISPNSIPDDRMKVIIESGMLWNRQGNLSRKKDYLKAVYPGKTIKVFTTSAPVDDDPYIDVKTPYLAFWLDGEIGISTGKKRTLSEIKKVINIQKKRLRSEAEKYGELAEVYIAVQAGVAWNLIYEPKFDRVVSTVGRLWNEEYGGFCTFGWDNFFLAYMTGLASRDLAFANVIEHLRGKTEQGFIPNDNRGNGSKSFDRSQPPVGGIMVKEVYKTYPEKWFLKATFDDLLGWNRWWHRARVNEGLLSYGSSPAKNPFNEPVFETKTAAGYESGMDDSPMYIGVPFNKKKHTLELQDVGLNSLYIADCRALAEMANIIDRVDDQKELETRAKQYTLKMEELWSPEFGAYLNYRTDVDSLSTRVSPTLFYPLMAKVGNDEKNEIIMGHFYNTEEFYGEWMLPSTTRNDPTFSQQRYWKGAIWPPLNFLTYLSLRQAGYTDAATELSEKSLKLIMTEWTRKGYVSENYSAITGTGDDSRLSSDRFHSWGALFGIMTFIENGYLPQIESPME